MERRLSAVLACDMVGYSRLTGVDEQGTLAAFRRHRNDIFNPRAAQYHGRIVKFTGDGALIEFGSVVDSVCFAVEVQVELGRENSGVSEDRQFLYRIGINIGDVVLDEGDIYGDGVNVAARLQELAILAAYACPLAPSSKSGEARPYLRIFGRKTGQEHCRSLDGL